MTLIELLVAMVVLSVGLVGTAMALTRIHQLTQMGIERSLGENLMRDLLTQARLYYLGSQPGAFATYSQPIGTACAVADASWLCDSDGVVGDPSLGGYAAKERDRLGDETMPFDIRDMALSAPWCCPPLPGAYTSALEMPPTTCRTPTANPEPRTGAPLFASINYPTGGGLPLVEPLESVSQGTPLLVLYDRNLEPEYSDAYDGIGLYGPFVACWRIADLGDADDTLDYDAPIGGYPRFKKFQILLTWVQSGAGGGQFALVGTTKFGY